MNSITKFFHELFNPHCEHCSSERREQREDSKYCGSCDALATENARLVRDNERLLNSLLDKPEPVVEKQMDVRDLKPIQTSRMPYMPSAVRRQMLERESRHTTQLKDNAPKPDSQIIDKDVELQELETELDNVRKEREQKVS